MHILRNSVSVSVLYSSSKLFFPLTLLLLLILQPVVLSVPILTVTTEYPSDSALLIAMH